MTDGKNATIAERDWFSPVGDSVLAAMRRRQVAAIVVAEKLPGGIEQLRSILSGEGDIDAPAAEALARTLGGSRTFWLNRQRAFAEALSRSVFAVNEADQSVWLERIPLPGKARRGLRSARGRRAELERRLRFYGVSSLAAWHARYGADRLATRFRTSQSFTSDEGALSMWLRRGEIEAALVETARWDGKLLKSLLPEIRKLSRFGRPTIFVPKLRELLAKAGVAFVFVRSPEGCRASGASRMIAADKAMLLVSFRHRSDDQFWFTVFHELGHLILHGASPFVDMDDGSKDDPRELEANAFAEEQIVPRARVAELESLPPSYKPIITFAKEVGVCPGLILGQLQHRRLAPFSISSNLQRRWRWAEIEEAFAG